MYWWLDFCCPDTRIHFKILKIPNWSTILIFVNAWIFEYFNVFQSADFGATDELTEEEKKYRYLTPRKLILNF